MNVKPTNFIKEIINKDNETNKHNKRVSTRFPPEPNGYIHIGHAKSIVLNFGLAKEYNGTCNLRFDDTNPSKEDVEYVDSIKEDVKWLGYEWDNLYFASDYFDQMYDFAVSLIQSGDAYVCQLSPEDTRKYRGDFTHPGEDSPFRNRSVEENLELFEKMKHGEFKDGEAVLRAKIDMKHPNMNMRDPAIYRIRHASHHRTGDKWSIYPMYDFAHGLEDSIEKITHSICTLEFEDHRPLYDWFLDKLGVFHPQQIEFARLNLTYTIMSKRKLLELVQKQKVTGWDDPRMPTISGMRRRGYTPKSIVKFCERIGVAKRDSIVDVSLLEHSLREDLNETSPRVMAVLDPLKIVIKNFPEGKTKYFDAPFHPEKPELGSRKVPFSREVYIERDDFKEEPPRKWHRLSPGKEIRLRYACIIKCEEVIKDSEGKVTELICTWDPNSLGGSAPDGRKVRGTSHWVSKEHAITREIRLYDRLFNVPNPVEGDNYLEHLNSESLKIIKNAKLEPALASVEKGSRWQFERLGYFCVDSDTSNGNPVFNRTVSLRDSWAKVERSNKQKKIQNPPKAKKSESSSEITFDQFAKIKMKVGVVLEANLVDGADKLLQLKVDIGNNDVRNVFAGVRVAYPDPAVLVGKKVVVVANLKPRKMKFGISEAMLLAASGDSRLNLLTLNSEVLAGDEIS